MILRLAVDGLMAGHGAQKLFGSFSGPGIEGTAGFMEMLGLKPGRPWAWMAGLSEFGGGVLTLLGFLNPVGPLGVIGSMVMATKTAHGGKPIWVTEGGAELPVGCSRGARGRGIKIAVGRGRASAQPRRFFGLRSDQGSPEG